ncbi:hypothetical protein [Coprococcus sp. AF21-14LB]|uniref:hypothetical protein n=1 Tax=Coprococcus sp. AF21-14LB TaxID=2292231 RepID=UPI001FA8B86C|nr:hypothetical protein [Coprococcus sp. AF21-14LB]
MNYLQNSELYKHWYPILPVSSIQHDNHGISGIALSMPAIVGKDGIEGTVPISLNSQEEEAMQHSAETLENIIQENLLST